MECHGSHLTCSSPSASASTQTKGAKPRTKGSSPHSLPLASQAPSPSFPHHAPPFPRVTYLSSTLDLFQLTAWRVAPQFSASSHSCRSSDCASPSSPLVLLLFCAKPRFTPRLPAHRQLLSLFLSLSLCRFPALANSSSFWSLRQPDHSSYMSLPERSL